MKDEDGRLIGIKYKKCQPYFSSSEEYMRKKPEKFTKQREKNLGQDRMLREKNKNGNSYYSSEEEGKELSLEGSSVVRKIVQ